MARKPTQTDAPVVVVEVKEPGPRAAETTRVIVMADHVYLPVDLGAADWATEDTKRYARREKLVLPADLAAFLIERGQCEDIS